jgi:glucosamine-6-phosphate deaminase
MCTLSSLQLHQHALLVCDSPATLELKVKTVKYFKDIEAIASSSGFTQSLPTSATGQEKRKSVGEELDRTTTTPDTLEPEKILSNGEFLAEPISLVAGMQNMRSPTPEFRPDRMSSRIGMTTGNGFGGHNGGKVNLQNMGAEIAVT